MQFPIMIRDQRFDAAHSDSDAARELVAHLPVTGEMVDHGGVEQTAPSNDLSRYCGDWSSYTGTVVLGRLNGDAALRLSERAGPVTATVVAG